MTEFVMIKHGCVDPVNVWDQGEPLVVFISNPDANAYAWGEWNFGDSYFAYCTFFGPIFQNYSSAKTLEPIVSGDSNPFNLKAVDGNGQYWFRPVLVETINGTETHLTNLNDYYPWDGSWVDYWGADDEGYEELSMFNTLTGVANADVVVVDVQVAKDRGDGLGPNEACAKTRRCVYVAHRETNSWVIEDTFSQSTGTDLDGTQASGNNPVGESWTKVYGTIEGYFGDPRLISGPALYVYESNVSNATAVFGWIDFFDDSALVGRYVDQNNYWEARLINSNENGHPEFQLNKHVGGVITTMDYVELTGRGSMNSGSFQVRLTCWGNKIEAELAHVLMSEWYPDQWPWGDIPIKLVAEDSAHNTATKWGMFGTTATTEWRAFGVWVEDAQLRNTYLDGSYANIGNVFAQPPGNKPIQSKAPRLPVESGAFVLTGSSAEFSRVVMEASAGALSLTGATATLTFAEAPKLEGAPGSFALTGIAANLFEGAPPLEAAAGSFALTGSDVIFQPSVMAAEAGSFAVSGSEAWLTQPLDQGLEAWFEFDTKQGPSTWLDETANSNDLSEAGTTGTISMVSDGYGGQSAVDFDGTDVWLENSPAGVWATSSSANYQRTDMYLVRWDDDANDVVIAVNETATFGTNTYSLSIDNNHTSLPKEALFSVTCFDGDRWALSVRADEYGPLIQGRYYLITVTMYEPGSSGVTEIGISINGTPFQYNDIGVNSRDLQDGSSNDWALGTSIRLTTTNGNLTIAKHATWSRLFDDGDVFRLWNHTDVWDYDQLGTTITAKAVHLYEMEYALTGASAAFIYSGQSTLLENLLSWWTMDEVSGDRYDSVGGRTMVEVNGVPSTTSAKVGRAADFSDSSFDHLQNESAGLDLDADWTVAGWFKADTVISTDRFTLFFTSNGVSGVAYFFMDTYGTALRAYAYTGSWDGDAAVATISAGTWYHVVARFDASAGTYGEITIHVDGSLASTITLTGPMQSATMNAIRFGRNNNATDRYLDGKLDEWGWWDRVITTDEIAELYNSGNGVGYGDLIT